jgi:hypothetical protein
LYPFFMSADNDIIEDTTQRPMPGAVWYPSSQWQAGDFLQMETLPWDIGNEFSFCVGVVEGEVWGEVGRRLRVGNISGAEPAYAQEERSWVRLHTFVRRPAWLGGQLKVVRLADEARLPANRLQVTFGDGLELLGYALDRQRAPAGVERRLVLYWRAVQPSPLDYTIFVHVTGDAGRSLPQGDGGPNWRGPLPTSSWPAGQVVPDAHRLVVPADAPAGRYVVSVGLYDWRTMQRLPAHDAAGQSLGDEIRLLTLDVGE